MNLRNAILLVLMVNIAFALYWGQQRAQRDSKITLYQNYKLPVAGGTVQLLSESKEFNKEVTSVAPNKPKSSQHEETVQLLDINPIEDEELIVEEQEFVCEEYLNLGDSQSAEKLKKVFLQRGLDSRVKETIVVERTDYWVHLPKNPSRKVAELRLEEVRARGLQSFIIPEGDLENAISLGIFSQIANAEKMIGEAKSRGFNALIKELPREAIRYSVMVIRPKSESIDEYPLENSITSINLQQVEKIVCSEVANAGEFH